MKHLENLCIFLSNVRFARTLLKLSFRVRQLDTLQSDPSWQDSNIFRNIISLLRNMRFTKGILIYIRGKSRVLRFSLKSHIHPITHTYLQNIFFSNTKLKRINYYNRINITKLFLQTLHYTLLFCFIHSSLIALYPQKFRIFTISGQNSKRIQISAIKIIAENNSERVEISIARHQRRRRDAKRKQNRKSWKNVDESIYAGHSVDRAR